MADLAALAKSLAAYEKSKARNRLARYKPYPKQAEFHEAGVSFRERLFMAGNQLGKSFSGSYEIAIHVTGRYPDWWKGKRFKSPPLVWTGSETNESSREIIQAALLGTESVSLKDQNMGTGSIPFECIKKVTKRLAGVTDVADQIFVKHITGGLSRVVLKTYDQGRTKWQGKPVDVVWFDEEPPADIYSEGVTRTNATNGVVLTTFTPLKGYTEVVERFLRPKEGDIPRHVTNMTINDAHHYSAEQRKAIIAAYPEHERKTRAMGIPMAGEGMVYPISEEEIRVDPFEIPRHFARICGIDFGISHPAAAIWLAWDRDTDKVYLYDCYRKSGETPVYHAQAINARGKWIPVAWPHDGMQQGKSDGRPLKDHYRAAGVNMMKDSARYDKDIGGAQPIEPAVMDILERMRTGRFKVFSTCSEWFEEMRMYHRKDGKIVPVNDDLMSATRYGIMMLRKAITNTVVISAKPRYVAPIVGGRIWA